MCASNPDASAFCISCLPPQPLNATRLISRPHGRWRILEHHSLYQELVVEVEAISLRDADEIAERFVASAGDAFTEMLIYVHPESPRPAPRVRRVRWTRAHGFESIEFSGLP